MSDKAGGRVVLEVDLDEHAIALIESPDDALYRDVLERAIEAAGPYAGPWPMSVLGTMAADMDLKYVTAWQPLPGPERDVLY